MRNFAIMLAAVAMIVAACGGTDQTAAPAIEAEPADVIGEAPVVVTDGDTHNDGDVDRTVDVTLSEFDFSFDGDSVLVVEAGETVQFVVTNAGVVEHEFRLTTAAEAAKHVGTGHTGHDDGIGEGDGILLLVAVGETGTIDVTFTESGEYDIVACLIPGHYEAGMSQPFEYS